MLRMLLVAVVMFALPMSLLAVPFPYDLSKIEISQPDRESPSVAQAAPGDVLCNVGSVYVPLDPGEGGSDVWGWEAPDGTEYAIMGFYSGIAFVNTTTMQVVARVMIPCGSGGTWRDIKTYQNYCYAVTECSNSGLLTIDMSGLPNSVRVVGVTPTSIANGWHNISIDTTKGFAHLGAQNTGFMMMDLANPEAPVEVGFVSTGGSHDLYVDNDTAWVAESFSPFWSIWDLTNKSNPVRIAHIAIANSGFVHQIWPSADRSVTVTTEETIGKTVKFWNTSDLNNIQFMGEYLAPSQLAHNAFIKGDTVIIAHYESGVVAVDITNPALPVEIDRFDTWPSGEGTGFNGCWGAFPYTSSGKIYASNLSNGMLFVFSDIGLTADTVFGAPPLTVQFDGATCGTVNSWSWEFGDGDSSSIQNPSHTYTAAGLYDVNLVANTTGGPKTLSAVGMIAVVAESLYVPNVFGDILEKVRVDIYAANHIPTLGYQIPIEWGGPLFLALDSVSTAGLRTEYMGAPQLVHFDDGNKRRSYRIESTTPLPPGNGPVMSLFIQMPILQFPDPNPIEIDGYPGQAPKIFLIQTELSPTTVNGQVSMSCCVGITGNVDDDAGSIIDIGDLTALIGFLFIPPNTPPICMEEANVDGDTGGVIDIGDLTALIAFLFIPPNTSPAACQ